MTQPWEKKQKQKSSLILTVQPTKATHNHRDNEDNEGQLLLAYQETSQQQEEKKNYCSPTKRRVSSKKKRKTTAHLPRDESAARRRRKTTARLPRDESATGHLKKRQQEKRKKRAAQAQKTRVVDVCLKAARKKPDSEVTGPCSLSFDDWRGNLLGNRKGNHLSSRWMDCRWI